MLEIKDLHVTVDGEEILKGVSLTVEKGKVYALMGPNGSGKSTLANVIMGHPKYTITKGNILLEGQDITKLSPDQRAKKGLFLSFQYPKEVAGITLTNFLRAAYNATHEPLSVVKFYKLLKSKMQELHVNENFARRYVNTGFSGGEKKKAEMLQMLVLQPAFAILDETDSGLDIDALKVVAEGINLMKNESHGLLLITHYYRILHYVTPDVVYILRDGKIVKTGGKELAQEIEERGFSEI